MVKKFLKWLITEYNCRLYGVPHVKGLYIGPRCKVAGAKRITLWGGVNLRSDNMLIALPSGKIEIGEGFDMGVYSRIGSRGYVKIGKDVLTGPHVFIADFNHGYADPTKPVIKQADSYTPSKEGKPTLEIGDGSWLGTNVVIAGNIRVGKHCVIGANSVVTKDIPDYSVAVGIPAKVIKRYNFDTEQWEKVERNYH